MKNAHFVGVSQAIFYCVCAALVAGCRNGDARATSGKPAVHATRGWVPPRKEDIPADVDPKVRRVIEMTFSETAAERERGAAELRGFGGRAIPAIPFLVRLLGDPGDNLHGGVSPAVEASITLRHLGKPAIPHLIAALRADKGETRVGAIMLLQGTADPRAIDPIIGALEDPHPKVRFLAAHAVGKMRENRAVEPLIRLLKDGRAYADHAARVLGRIKDTRAVEPLIAVLEDRDRGDDLRESAAWSLGLIGDPRAADALLGRANDPAENVDIRANAARALGRLKDPRAFELLKGFLETEHDLGVRVDAIGGLGALADQRCVRLLTKLLHTEGGEPRGQVAFALVWTDKPAAIDALIAATDVLVGKDSSGAGSRDVFLREIDALSLSSNPRAYLWAINALRHADQDVRSLALRAFAEGECYGDIWVGSMDTGPDRRAYALKDPRIIDPLIAIAKDPKSDETMRERALSTLRKTEAPEALKFLESIEGKQGPASQTEPDD